MEITRKYFGQIPQRLAKGMTTGKYEGQEIYNYVIKNDNGITVEISEYGAVIVKILIPDRNGRIDDVQLGYDNLWGYICNTECFGALVGRSANRIGGHSFVLDGKKFILKNNDSGANLHSSVVDNYFRRPWKALKTEVNPDDASVTLNLFSPDGDQGFPGNLNVTITYTLKNDGSLMLNYSAESDADTVLNLTNHSYINLGGNTSGSALDAFVWIDSDYVTHNRLGNVATGRILDIRGGALDFNIPKQLKKDFHANDYMLKNAKGYDFNYILKNNGSLKLAAYMQHKSNGRRMSVYTDMPGLQLYTGNFISKKGKGGHFYKDHYGVCFESQQFPNAINIKSFPSPVLKAHEKFGSCTIFKFTIEDDLPYEL